MANNYNVKWNFGVTDKLTSPLRKMSKSFEPLTKSAKRANRQFKIMQSNTAGLRNRINKTGKSIAGAGKSMTMGLSAPIAAFGALSLRSALTFEQSMNKVEALTKASGKELVAMRDMAKDLGSTTAFSASQAADAMSFLGMAGFKTNQILEATPALLNLAAASGTDLGRSADIASNILGSFGLKAKEMGRVADVLAATTAGANVDMEMMAESMKAAAPVAKMYGLTLEETAAVTGLLGNVGIQGSLAGNSLKNMFLNLTAPTSRAKALIKGLGVQVVDQSGKMRKLNDILIDLGPALGKLPKAKQLAVLNEVFGKRAIAGAGELLTQALNIGQDGKNAISRFTEELEKSNGAAKRMADIMMKGGPGAAKAFSSALEGLQIALSESGLMNGFTVVATLMADFFRWISALPKPVRFTIVTILTLVATIGPLLLIIGKLITMWPLVITAVNGLGASLIFLKGIFFKLAFLLKGVVIFAFKALVFLIKGAAIIAFKALVAVLTTMLGALSLLGVAAFMIYKNWKPIKAFFSDFLTDPIQQIKDMIGWVKELGNSALNIFGLGGESVDDKLKKQGFTISGPSGENVGAKKQIEKSNEMKAREVKAFLGIDFANMPKGTKVRSEDPDRMISFTGMAGAY